MGSGRRRRGVAHDHGLSDERGRRPRQRLRHARQLRRGTHLLGVNSSCHRLGHWSSLMNVRRLVLALSLVASGVTLAGQAVSQQPQLSVDEIVAKHLDAIGGLERLKDIQTMKKVAKVTMQGRETTTTMYFKRPNMSRQETTVDGK